MPEAPEKNQTPEAIGIIAGKGQFPVLVAQGAREAGHSVVICGFLGHTDPEIAKAADAFCMLHLGQFNKVIEFFRAQGVQRLCMAGAIAKPSALDIRPDFRAVKLLFSLRHKGKGDDAILRAILADLEHEGFSVCNPAEMAGNLYCPEGVLGQVQPDDALREAIAYGWPIARALGGYDIGQCLVVREGMVMAVECLEGTNDTLERGAQLGGAGCVALKLSKPGQERRVDLPSVGFETIRLLTSLKYAALVLETGNTLFFDREKAIQLADQNGLCVLARPSSED